MLFAPPLLLLLLANIFAVEAQQARFALWDLDRSGQSRRYVATLTADGDLTHLTDVNAYDQVNAVLRRGKVDFVLIIPNSFEEKLLVWDVGCARANHLRGHDAIRSPQISGFPAARSGTFSKAVLLEGREVGDSLVTLRTVHGYNPGVRSMVGMAPVLMTIFPSTHSMAIARGIFVKGLGRDDLVRPTLILGGMYLAGTAIALLSFRKRLK